MGKPLDVSSPQRPDPTSDGGGVLSVNQSEGIVGVRHPYTLNLVHDFLPEDLCPGLLQAMHLRGSGEKRERLHQVEQVLVLHWNSARVFDLQLW